MKRWINISDAVEITNNRVKPFKGERRYLATGDLIGDAVNESIVSVDYEHKPSRADLLVDEGDIIVARMQATNKVLLIDKSTEDLIVSTGFLTLQPQKDFDGSYLAHYFQSDVFQKQKDKYCSGATQKAINNGAFGKLQVPSYPLDEQKRIANILDHADALRQKRKQSLQFLDDFLRATFLDMFGDPVKNIKSWTIRKFGEVCPTRLGKMLDAKKQTGKNKKLYLGNANVLWGKFNLDNLSLMDFDDREMEELRLKKGDVLICEGGEVGRTAIWRDEIPECYFQKAIHRGRPDLSVILPEYIFYLMFFYSQNGGFKNYVSVATIAHLTGIKLKSMSVPVPPIELQNKFTLIVNNIEQIRKAMSDSYKELNNQFNALAQRYFG